MLVKLRLTYRSHPRTGHTGKRVCGEGERGKEKKKKREKEKEREEKKEVLNYGIIVSDASYRDQT